MARFRYSMQSILNIKLKLETQAKQEFSAARAALDREEEKLQALCDRKDGYAQAGEALLSGVLDLRAIEENRESAAWKCLLCSSRGTWRRRRGIWRRFGRSLRRS